MATVLQTNWDSGPGVGSIHLNSPMQANFTAGSLLVAAVTWEVPGITGIGCSDNHNGSWHLDADSGTLAGSGGSGGGRIAFFSVTNTFSGAATMTITAS